MDEQNHREILKALQSIEDRLDAHEAVLRSHMDAISASVKANDRIIELFQKLFKKFPVFAAMLAGPDLEIER